MDLIRIKDARLTYPPTFRRHRTGYDGGEDLLGDADMTGGDYEDEEEGDERTVAAGSLTPTVALRGLSLKVQEGEGLALLGRPASGRSTVLSLMGGLLRPDGGSVRVRGRAGGLPGAGAGFLRYLPVSENIVRNLMLLGESHARAKALVPEVASWVGVEDKTDLSTRALPRPVMRQLGYAAALHCEPTVFLADEDVATLPKPIRERGLERMAKFRSDGHALVIATNRRDVLKRLCTRGVVLDRGQVMAEGDIDEMLSVLKGVPMPDPDDQEKADEPSDD